MSLNYFHAQGAAGPRDRLQPNLLHRQQSPLSAELSGWVSTKSLGLLDIEVNIAGSDEFFANG